MTVRILLDLASSDSGMLFSGCCCCCCCCCTTNVVNRDVHTCCVQYQSHLLSRPSLLLMTIFAGRIWSPRRLSGAPSKIYQWFGPRSRKKNYLIHFVHLSLNYCRGWGKEPNLSSISDPSRLWDDMFVDFLKPLQLTLPQDWPSTRSGRTSYSLLKPYVTHLLVFLFLVVFLKHCFSLVYPAH